VNSYITTINSIRQQYYWRNYRYHVTTNI